MLRISPDRCARICGSTAAMAFSAPLMLMSSTASQLSQSRSAQRRLGMFSPALLHSASSRPVSSAIPRPMRAIPSRSSTSTGRTSARPPAAAISSASARSGASVRPDRATAHPAPAKARAMAAPIPDPAPVIHTVQLEISCSIFASR